MSNNVITGLFSSFIAKASALGFPVAMLRDVQKDYTFDDSDNNETSTTWNYINFQMSTMVNGAHISFSKPAGGGTAVQSIYHEATHAWLDLHENDKDVKKVQSEAEAYYKTLQLEDGSKVTNETRVFTEAAAEYVGHRTSRWFMAMQNLTMKNEEPDPKDNPKAKALLIKQSKETKSEYNTAMAERTFGYQMKSGSQVNIKAVIFNPLKEICDRRILESKFVETFDMDTRLLGLWKLLAGKYPEIDR